MTQYNGYYSIVQFCPDPARAEVANVGVLVFIPSIGYIDVRLSGGNDRIAHMFSRDSFDPGMINSAKEALQARITEDKKEFQTLEDLNRFVGTRANDLRLTEPRFLKTADPELEIGILFDEFIGGRIKRQKAINPFIEQVDKLFHKPNLVNRIEFKKKVELPYVRKAIEFPYSYKNGVSNLIQLPVFSLSNDQWHHRVFQVAGEGCSIQKQKDANNLKQKVTVIPILEFNNQTEQIQNSINGIFSEYDINVVNSTEIDAFICKVEQEAHL